MKKIIFLVMVLCVSSVLGAQEFFPSDTWKIITAEEASAVDVQSTDLASLKAAAFYYYLEAGKDLVAKTDYASRKAAADQMLKLITRAYRLAPRDQSVLILYGKLTMDYVGLSSADSKKPDISVAIKYSGESAGTFTKLKELAPKNIEVYAYRLFADIRVPPFSRWGINESMAADVQTFYTLSAQVDQSKFSAAQKEYFAGLQIGVRIIDAALTQRKNDKKLLKQKLTQITQSDLQNPTIVRLGLKEIYNGIAE